MTNARKAKDKRRVDNTPSQQQQDTPKMVRVSHTEETLTSYSGPLPDPATLKKYDEVVPGAAQRFLTSFEKEQSHRHVLEAREMDLAERHLKGLFNRSWGGLIGGLLVSGLALALSAYLSLNGQPSIGAVIGGTTVVSLVVAFLGGKKADTEAKLAGQKKPKGEQK